MNECIHDTLTQHFGRIRLSVDPSAIVKVGAHRSVSPHELKSLFHKTILNQGTIGTE